MSTLAAAETANNAQSRSDQPLLRFEHVFKQFGGTLAVNDVTLDLFSHLGGFLGPFLMGWLKDVFGGTDYGVLALVAFLVISAVITATLPNTEHNR